MGKRKRWWYSKDKDGKTIKGRVKPKGTMKMTGGKANPCVKEDSKDLPPPLQGQTPAVTRGVPDVSGLFVPELDMEKLKERCYQTAEEMTASVQHKEGQIAHCGGEWSVWINNNSDILAVCHMDTVRKPTHFARAKDGLFDILYCETLDDRLGCHIALDVLPQMNINVDVLLTTGEETGKSTAKYFKTEKKYRWIVEFDRRGEDVVLYDYEDDPEWDDALLSAGFNISMGSFSDISTMESLGVSAFNMGIGYHDEHGYMAHMFPHEYYRQMKRFSWFVTKYRDQSFTHVERLYTPYNNYAYFKSGGDYNAEDWRGNWGGMEKGAPVTGAVSVPYPDGSPHHTLVGMKTCGVCSVHMNERHMHWSVGGGWLCEECHSQYFNAVTGQKPIGDEPDGSDSLLIECPECDSELRKDDCLYHNGNWECPNCLCDVTLEVEGYGEDAGAPEGSLVGVGMDKASERSVEKWHNSTEG